MKKRSLVLGCTLAMIMSSCVYSLFPIYTEDTLVFKKELVGKWVTGNDPDEYILFESTSSREESIIPEEKPVYKDSVIGENFSIRTGDKVFIEVNGRKIYDKDSIKAHMNRIMADIEQSTPKGITDKGSVDYDLSAYTTNEKSYKMTVVEDDRIEVYIAHLVEIGGDLFMDLYPTMEYSSANFSDNFFPVHTFLKVNIKDDKLDFTFFDLEKLNRLFESNLIRIRHENVDGTILITAQPKELQKFLDKYSDDESVFDSVDTYTRVEP